MLIILYKNQLFPNVKCKGLAPKMSLLCDNIFISCPSIAENILSNQQQKDQEKESVDSFKSYIEKLEPFVPYDQFGEHWLVLTLKEICTLYTYRWNIPNRVAKESSELDFIV
ncbi:hypothetical protein BDA99DRAFT_540470 [Phascolomyces articulosus]|uniref:Uncharacterized protein n=1 Tax=Phascolomyces articulosus TaxID=60185 RepID=A0AAD5PAS9_9FUNG|nr:hypothetical protein BDA99DRAFT_540470 [Phascolomyces articulosus]